MMEKPTYEELAAQAEVLRQAFSELVGNTNTEANEFNQVIISRIDFDAVHNCFEQAPSACLAQIKAKAIREFANEICGDCKTDFQCRLSNIANQYAERIKR